MKEQTTQDKATARPSFLDEPWHVRFICTNKGRNESYGVFRESERNVSGTPIARFSSRDWAQFFCDEHNEHAALVAVAEAAQQMDNAGNYTERLHEALAALAAVRKEQQ